MKDADYVVHCGAVIPPKADHNPEDTWKTNLGGTRNIVEAIRSSGRSDEIKLVHISTVAVYGNRDYHHPWCRMGDPVMSSAYDYYSVSKIKSERCVVESGLPHWVVLRQTAVYHKYFLGGQVLSENMKTVDLHTALKWKCHNGHEFDSTPFAVLKAGFWCPVCCEAVPWAFDKAASHVPFYAQVWYDTHSKSEENNVYPYDEHEDDDLL